MKRFTTLLTSLLLLTIFSSFVIAQEGGEGGTIFYSDTSDPSILNPLLGGDTTSSAIYARIYPSLFDIDTFSGLLSTDLEGSLATDWSYNDDGTVLTISLRDDATWSDGTSITAHDYVWAVEALRTGLLDTPRSTSMWESLDDGTPGSGSVVDVVAADDYTIEVTFAQASCNAINELFSYAVPSHIYEADFGDDLAAMNEEPLYDPGVYFGAFVEPEIIAGDRVSLVANQDFPDAQLGFVNPDGITILNLPNSDVAIERFRAGDITLTGIPGAQQADFADDPQFQTYRFNRLGYVFFVFNHANPDNPQNAYDEDANLIEQEPHPILGDVLVRQAIVTAVNMDAIIENNLGGNAVRVGIPSIPASWDWNGDLLYPFDPAAASDLLDEAGWLDEDGDGVRECVTCFFSEIDADYVGTPMSLSLMIPAGGTEEGELMDEFIAQSMRDIGIDAQIEYLDWGSAFLPALDGQTFDMANLAWSLGLPLDPDNRAIFGSAEDIAGQGFNFGSYVNPELDAIYDAAVDPTQTDGCSTEGRLALYNQANEIVFEELPYMFMYANLSMTAAQATLENWDPSPFSRTWQEDALDTVSGQ